MNSWLAKKARYNWLALDLDNHTNHFSKKSLKKLLEQNNFKIKTISYFSPEQSPFDLLQTVLNLFFKEHNYLFKMMKHELKVNRPHYLLSISIYPFALTVAFIFGLLKQGSIIKVYSEKVI